jgi:hypothetical protein
VALGEAVLAEALDLLEAALCEVGVIAARDHALDELLPKLLIELPLALPRGHGAAQAVGLARREAGGDDRQRIACSWKSGTPSVLPSTASPFFG